MAVNLVHLSGAVIDPSVEQLPDGGPAKITFHVEVTATKYSSEARGEVPDNQQFLCERWVRKLGPEDRIVHGDPVTVLGQLVQKRGGPTRVEVEDLRLNRNGWVGSTNLVWLSGGISKDSDARVFERTGSTKLQFSVAISRARFNPEVGRLEPDTAFVSCERWLATDLTDADHLYKGDGVFVMGRLSAYTDEQSRVHTRLDVEHLTVTKRGKTGKAQLAPVTTGYAPAPSSAAPAADPWAPSARSYGDNPPF